MGDRGVEVQVVAFPLLVLDRQAPIYIHICGIVPRLSFPCDPEADGRAHSMSPEPDRSTGLGDISRVSFSATHSGAASRSIQYIDSWVNSVVSEVCDTNASRISCALIARFSNKELTVRRRMAIPSHRHGSFVIGTRHMSVELNEDMLVLAIEAAYHPRGGVGLGGRPRNLRHAPRAAPSKPQSRSGVLLSKSAPLYRRNTSSDRFVRNTPNSTAPKITCITTVTYPIRMRDSQVKSVTDEPSNTLIAMQKRSALTKRLIGPIPLATQGR